jgi:hypothetical protein
MNGLNDRDLEALLRKYRPASKRTSSTSAGRTWPWAIAASILIAVAFGLHGRVDHTESRVDEQRARAVLHGLDAGLDDSADGSVFAMWIAHREAVAARQAEEQQAALVPLGPDQGRL